MHPHHQQAVMRREQEVSQALAHTADARKFYQEFANVVQPYMGFIQAENATPIQAVQNLMQTAAMLRTAPPSQKAALVAGIVSQYGVDLQMLDQALTAQLQGRRPSVNPNDQVLSLIDQKLQPFNQFLSVLEQRRAQEQQTITAEAGQSIEQFMADPANEFAQDVAEDMADILEHSARRGVQMDLQEAYKRATLLHPTISKIVESRAVGAAQQTAAAQRAKQASVSVSGSGAPNAGSNGADYGDLRSAIVAAAQEHAGRR
jgi:flagellar biosynthesis/type III secretory pathway chaperone